MKPRDRLRIAAQKSGRLSDAGRDLLARSGLRFRESRDRLFCYGETEPVDLLLVRDDDIPGLIAEGVCDLGIVGRNVLREQSLEYARRGERAPFSELRTLGFGRCRLSIAVPQDFLYTGPASLAGTRIATSYPALMADWLDRNGVKAEVVTLSGSVEIAPKLGKADVICDLVSTGATLAANQLREVASILDSEAVLAGPAEALQDERGELAAQLLRRLDGVLEVRDSKLVMLQVDRAELDQVVQLLPAANAPTVMAIEGNAQAVALQALCRGAFSWQQLEDIKRAGARGLMILPVEQMLA
ncbi:ATP phosphoribosyltransferase [Pseudomarimonas salicorniae]|uniref:ATP phosphoribosyltransferase n=1 Tax=Pseudomarimonas salicorniae TaxID=2933270 RepID=A0ABT0GLI6_9GAMM|nr:ATP phosphoribosyltransferase [Lysobacter sp. CAU 1642]MCK7595399.1 ATP phosphoribosyltransferase [Lysobacter sp. CAU 1642]